ncbi:MAG: PilW family protein [Gammaproteobacteria bacterium]|nr:PilW family protein [Gammaproteobacteria bacterium]
MFNPSLESSCCNENVRVYTGVRPSAGFTLIELLISITLGLLLVAAASQLFFSGVIGVRLQQAGSDTQDNGLFGLDFMSKDIRLANFGNTNYLNLTDNTTMGGIVLSADTSSSLNSNLPLVRTTYSPGSYLPAGLLSHGDGDALGTTNQWQGLSNVTTSGGAALASDQLTILYQAPAAMINCAGNPVSAGDYVLERFFLRADSVGPATTSGNANLVLACDAGIIISGLNVTPAPVGSVAASSAPPSPAAIVPSVVCTKFATPTTCATAFGGAGQTIMSRVDYLHFMLGTKTSSGNMAYYSINQYMALTAPKPRIVSVQVAALVRSLDNTGSATVKTSATYTMFDQTVKPTSTAGGFVRKPYVTTVALRNALGSVS